jgi:hypothetical protein
VPPGAGHYLFRRAANQSRPLASTPEREPRLRLIVHTAIIEPFGVLTQRPRSLHASGRLIIAL